ncbi:MAG: sulfurtransferase [Candidatus Competibacterales bacterium]
MQRFFALLSPLFLAPTLAQGATPLVDPQWVAAHGCDDDVAVVALRREAGYRANHLPCALHAPYADAGWRAKRDDVPGMLPPVAELEGLIGGLGIDNDTHVVLYTPGLTASDMGAATRVYWTFKVLGHDRVSILNGGYSAYTAAELPLSQAASTPQPTTFKGVVQDDLLVDRHQVAAALEGGKAVLVDHRPQDQFVGINRHTASARSGTLPGARSVPERWRTVHGGGEFRDPDTLRQLFQLAEVPLEGEKINFCNTGHWASLGWFVSHELLGNKDAKLYDGSMVEWSLFDTLPMDQQVRLTP